MCIEIPILIDIVLFLFRLVNKKLEVFKLFFSKPDEAKPYIWGRVPALRYKIFHRWIAAGPFPSGLAFPCPEERMDRARVLLLSIL